jgi:hypothetical protein
MNCIGKFKIIEQLPYINMSPSVVLAESGYLLPERVRRAAGRTLDKSRQVSYTVKDIVTAKKGSSTRKADAKRGNGRCKFPGSLR